jgi:pimeloyl-ACP methyl ester carboxylesterase
MLNDTQLILLPGTLCDERVFAPVLDALGSTGRTLAIGGATSAADMARLLRDQAPDRFALCGFSLGAIVALEMVAQAPHRVDRLALLGCNARKMPADKVASRRATIAVAEREGIESYIAGAWDASVPAWRHDDQDLRTELEAMASDTSFAHFRDQIEIAINRADSRPRLGAIDVPTLVACGAEDRVCPPELSKEIAAGIPGATLALVERAGHYLTLDQPQAMARLLRDWLAASTPIQTRKVPKEFS